MASTSPDPWRYETAIHDIEQIIHQIESGELELEVVVEQFQTASETLRTCQTFLRQKQAQVDLVIEQLLEEPDTPDLEEEEEDLAF